jgi:hypothetical protein
LVVRPWQAKPFRRVVEFLIRIFHLPISICHCKEPAGCSLNGNWKMVIGKWLQPQNMTLCAPRCALTVAHT